MTCPSISLTLLMWFVFHLKAKPCIIHKSHSQRSRNTEEVQNSRYKTQAQLHPFKLSNKADNSKGFFS